MEDFARLQRTIGWWPGVAAPATMALVAIAGFALRVPPTNPWFVGAVLLSLILALVFSLRLALRRRKLVRAHCGRVCVQCWYPLDDLPSPGPCPECGRPFPPDSYRSTWIRAGFPVD